MSDRNSENFGGNRGYGAISGSEVGREGPRGGNASGSSVEWGPAIAVDGKRPGWLAIDQVAQYQHRIERDGSWGKGAARHWNWNDEDWQCVTAIRLPADHPHYRQAEAAVPEGMKAWHGGDAAPADWDSEKPIAVIDDGKVSIRYGDRWDWSREPINAYGRKLLRVVAYTPVATPIDWSGELEAVHEDGRVVAVTLAETDRDGDRYISPPLPGRYELFHADGSNWSGGPWRIRNVPQPTPQADTKPDLTPRAPCMTISEVREMVAKGEDAVIATMLERGYALPEPVDPDVELVDEVMFGFGWEREDARFSDAHAVAFDCIKRGRALALAGEKEA